MDSQRRELGGLGWREALGYFLLAALLEVVIGVRAQPDVLQGQLTDPDTLMRLVRLRDILAQHAPLHIVARDSSGDGTILHWSHFLDSLLLVMAAPIRLWMSWDRALHAAAMAFGPINVGLLGVATAWATAPLADKGWRWTAPVWAALAAPIVSYGLPGVADHHILLTVGAVMMAGAAGRVAVGDAATGVTLGAWSAASIWLSPEAMPFAVMTFGGTGVAWLLRPGLQTVGTGIAAAAITLVMLTGAALAVDPPAEGFWAATIDGISLVYVLLATILFIISGCLCAIDRLRLPTTWRGFLGGGLAVSGLLLWVALFPVMLRGSGVLGDTPEARAMYSDIEEMLPVTSLPKMATYLLNGTLAAALLGWLAVRDRRIGWRSTLWVYAALAALGVVVLGQMHIRFTIYPSAAAAMILPVALTECTRVLFTQPKGLQAMVRVTLVATTFMAMRTDALASMSGLTVQEPPEADKTCDSQGMSAALASRSGNVVLTEVNDVPALLYRTGIRTVGSLYPGGVAGYTRMVAAWRSGPADAEPSEVRETKAALLLFCTREGRPVLVEDLPKQTLWDRLNRRNVPPWLHLIAATAHEGSEARLYEIVSP